MVEVMLGIYCAPKQQCIATGDNATLRRRTMRRITLGLVALLLVGGLLVREAHAAPAEQADPAAASLTGQWSSDWGLFTLRHDPMERRVMGEWQQPAGMGACSAQQRPAGCVGRVEQGRYDPASRVLEFTYYQDWNDTRGTARLTLAPDGAVLSGTWTQPGDQGTWTLQR
jgi:hypothetical protein